MKDLTTVDKSFSNFCANLWKVPNFNKMDRNQLAQHIETGFKQASISEQKVKQYKHELSKLYSAKQVQYWISNKVLAGAGLQVTK